MNEFELRRRLKDLKADRQPEVDLWEGIAGQLRGIEPWRPARKPRTMLWPWAAAASVAIAVVTGLWFARNVVAPESDEIAATTPVDSVESADAQPRGMPNILRREAEAISASYDAAVASTRGDVRRDPSRDAASRELDSAAAQLRDALAQDPEAVYLLDLLRRTEERRLDVARQTAA